MFIRVTAVYFLRLKNMIQRLDILSNYNGFLCKILFISDISYSLLGMPLISFFS